MTPDKLADDPRYVAARRVLLDALVALAPHGDAFIIAGAQAVYLRTGSAELDEVIAPFTTDGDLAVNPSLLGEDPQLEVAMTEAGFNLKVQSDGHTEPGIWVGQATIGTETFDVPVDLIVPEKFAGSGSRAARLVGHGDRVARRAIGLEAALIDCDLMTITALELEDGRSITAYVAGIAALLVAKAHKIHDRLATGRMSRLSNKDAADVVRLMQSTSPTETGERLASLMLDPTAGEVTKSAMLYLNELFGRRGARGIEMAAQAMQIAVSADRIEAISIAYTRELQTAYGRS
jgi:hypothetical protein